MCLGSKLGKRWVLPIKRSGEASEYVERPSSSGEDSFQSCKANDEEIFQVGIKSLQTSDQAKQQKMLAVGR